MALFAISVNIKHFFVCLNSAVFKVFICENRKLPFLCLTHPLFQYFHMNPKRTAMRHSQIENVAKHALNSKVFCLCKNNGEMVTRCRRYNALKLSCMTTNYVFWSPIFPPQTTKLPPPILFQQVTIPATLVCAFYHQHCWVQIGFRHWTKPCSSRHTTRWNGV